uniref:Uncharacterized protein n=1 Tax=Strigops habroptila TaxID=2489341 RepID=A0A672UW05_STRHB
MELPLLHPHQRLTLVPLVPSADMEANNHFTFTSAPAASGPKPASASGDSPFAPSSALGFSPQGKSLNGGMNVNGFSTVSHPSTSGTLAPSSPPAGTQPLRSYDCLWDYAPYPGTGGLKDGRAATPPLFPLNGTEPRSPGHGTNLRAPAQELWGNGTAGPMGLNFDSQELYDSFHEQSFELMQNGPPGFYGAAQPFSLPPEEPGTGDGGTDAAAKEIPAALTENGGGLVGSMELEEAQPGRSRCCGTMAMGAGTAPLALSPSCCYRGCVGSVVPFRPEDVQLQRGCPRRGGAGAGGRVAHRPPAGGCSYPQRGPSGALWVAGHRSRCRGSLRYGRLAARERQVPPWGPPRPARWPLQPPAPPAAHRARLARTARYVPHTGAMGSP